MQSNESVQPQYNLWTEPWIGLEHTDGEIKSLGLKQTLLHAHEFRGLYEASPLVIVGIHRLLTAILQYSLHPTRESQLKKLWNLERVPEELILEFEEKYADRFNLFSHDRPFYQSADIPIEPHKGDNIKSVAYLTPDIPSGSESTHYHHGAQSEQIFCPRCVADGLVCLPAFSTSGGAGIKPSINGVPPLYVIPGGKTLYESLVRSLTLPGYQPEVRSESTDLVWWERQPVIPRSSELNEVGYLHSLTFAPRRVRVYPEAVECICTCCGKSSRWGVKQMIFDMGESRAKDAPFWFDPFAAYKIRETKSPVPIRPQEGKATWREFGSLFLKSVDHDTPSTEKENKKDKTLRPKILDQIAVLSEGELTYIQVRCIGLRTDMKAKVFEWVDTGFEVPAALLRDEDAADWIEKSLSFAKECEKTISNVFRQCFGGTSKKQERYAQLKSEMMEDYWKELAEPFREMVLQYSTRQDRADLYSQWMELVIRTGKRGFSRAASFTGDDAERLRQRYQGEKLCNIYLSALKKKEMNA
jgi:CRISPR system Cascade subunit CasA